MLEFSVGRPDRCFLHYFIFPCQQVQEWLAKGSKPEMLLQHSHIFSIFQAVRRCLDLKTLYKSYTKGHHAVWQKADQTGVQIQIIPFLCSLSAFSLSRCHFSSLHSGRRQSSNPREPQRSRMVCNGDGAYIDFGAVTMFVIFSCFMFGASNLFTSAQGRMASVLRVTWAHTQIDQNITRLKSSHTVASVDPRFILRERHGHAIIAMESY